MRCKDAERRLDRVLDDRLEPALRTAVAEHIALCPGCGRRAEDERALRALLRQAPGAEPDPGFWDRLQPRLRAEKRLVPLLLWERWCFRALPVFMTLVLLLVGLVLLGPRSSESMTQTEALLLENKNPFSETQRMFDAQRSEDRNMMVIFASLDERGTSGRRP
jgi:anti-sigma factor RsiW